MLLKVWKNSSCVLCLPAMNWIFHVAVFAAEFLARAVLDGLDHLHGEIVAFDVGDLLAGVVVEHVLPDGAQQVRFPEAGVAVDEQGIVGSSRIFCHAHCRGVGKFIGIADDEAVEGIARGLGQGVFRPFGGHVVLHVLPGQHLQLEVLRKEVGQGVGDDLAVAVADDVRTRQFSVRSTTEQSSNQVRTAVGVS